MISFFFFLSVAEFISAKVIRAGIVGHIAVGIIYGKPLANILAEEWQHTFLVLGYVGLILIIFEGMMVFKTPTEICSSLYTGGLNARIDLLKQNFLVSLLGAATGVIFPIALSYLLLFLGFGYGE